MPDGTPPNFSFTGARADPKRLKAFGFRVTGGGSHQSKSMMFAELSALLSRGRTDPQALRTASIEENALGKSTKSTRVVTFNRLAALYGLMDQPALTRVMVKLWRLDISGHRLLALLVALARDPLLRDTAPVIVESTIGHPLKSPAFEAAIKAAHPNRFSAKMAASLSRNCAASWTQSGHLEGPVRKIRRRVSPSTSTVAFAALLATVAGFGGPAMLSSMWMRVLDLSPEQAMDQLRRAEAVGLARVRSAGDVTEISVRQPMAAALGMADLDDV